MATIDYKEKYEQAMERARQFIEKPYLENSAGIVEYIFPELKESEDERIRKELVSLFQDGIDGVNHRYNGSDCRRWLAWLEKQGEHANFRNKIQIGDKVTRNEDGVLVNLSQLNRVAKKQGEQKPAWSEEDEENRKNILYILNQLKGTAIYKEDKTAENCIDWLKSLKDRVQPKQEWSKEDEQMFEHIIEKATLKFSEWNCLKNDEINFLKSLHPQNKQEWTQDDIDMIDWLIRCCEKEYEGLCNDRYGHQDIVSDLKRDCRKKWDWLESLKEKVAPQKQWKPSEEQMKLLREVQQALLGKDCHNRFVDFMHKLKRLREEEL